MRRIAMAAIRLYQRHLSPLKGFCCAYSMHSGAASCSALGYRTVRRFGVVGGTMLLHERLHRCGVAHRRHGPTSPTHRHRRQAGFCDAACDVCGACDLASCAAGSCDVDDWDCSDGCGGRRRKNRSAEADAAVHVPLRPGHPDLPQVRLPRTGG